MTSLTTGATGVIAVASSIRRFACARPTLSGASTSSSRHGPERARSTAVAGSS